MGETERPLLYIVMNDLIIKKLMNNITETNKDKSSHWQKHLREGSNFLDELEYLGFGGDTKKPLKNVVHNLLIKIIFGNKVFETDTYNKYKSIFDQTSRFIDIDTIRKLAEPETQKYYAKKITIKEINEATDAIDILRINGDELSLVVLTVILIIL